jgi:hypothetical protein
MDAGRDGGNHALVRNIHLPGVIFSLQKPWNNVGLPVETRYRLLFQAGLTAGSRLARDFLVPGQGSLVHVIRLD